METNIERSPSPAKELQYEIFQKEQHDLIRQFNDFAKKHSDLIHGVSTIKYPNSTFMLHFVINQSAIRGLNQVIS
jgi:hypothetical protein